VGEKDLRELICRLRLLKMWLVTCSASPPPASGGLAPPAPVLLVGVMTRRLLPNKQLLLRSNKGILQSSVSDPDSVGSLDPDQAHQMVTK
jgi:hypothetical protein